MTPQERTRFLDEDLKYNDYKLIINAKSGHWVKAEKEAMNDYSPTTTRAILTLTRKDIYG